MNSIKLFFIGITIGMANVIPGVSGGTLAVVFNIYDKFINSITCNVKKLWGNRKFLVPLLCGMASGVLIFSKMITVLYGNFPVQTNFAFAGLVMGSIPLLAKYSFSDTTDRKGILHYASLALCILSGVVLLILFYYLGETMSFSKTAAALPDPTFKLAVRIFVAGFIGAIAMVVPGISGSLLMLIMGVYTIVMSSIPALFSPHTAVQAFLLLVPNGIGVLMGIICGAKLVSFLLKKAPLHTYSVILGLLLGSEITILPAFTEITSTPMAVASAVCYGTGFFIAFISTKFDK